MWDLDNVINVVRHYVLGDGKIFPRHQHATIDFALKKIAFLFFFSN